MEENVKLQVGIEDINAYHTKLGMLLPS